MNMDIILVSSLIVLSFVLTFLNWKILRETIIIRKETIIIRKESVKVRKALGDTDEPPNRK